MPTYEYTCRDCGERLEAVQSFSDEPLTTCPNCGGSLRKVFGAVGIVFKGSGFYKTDNRSNGSRSSATSSDHGNSKETSSSSDSPPKSNDSSSSSSDSSSSKSETSTSTAAPATAAPSAG
jgi:putative FmdB family regulatory protein